jgi:hypothetical protein
VAEVRYDPAQRMIHRFFFGFFFYFPCLLAEGTG